MNNDRIPEFISTCPNDLVELYHGRLSPATHKQSSPYYSIYRDILVECEKEKVLELKGILINTLELNENEEMILSILSRDSQLTY